MTKLAIKEKALLEIKEFASQRGTKINDNQAEEILNKYTSSVEKDFIQGQGDNVPVGFLKLKEI